MKTAINSFLRYFANASKSLKKKGLLLERPWFQLQEDGSVQKMIFRKNKELILSKNGAVQIGSWDYFPEANSLLIDRNTDKLLLNEKFVDENVLIFKKDGIEDEFFALANENTLPKYNIPEYFYQLKLEKNYIVSQPLNDNTILLLYFYNDAVVDPLHAVDCKVERYNQEFIPLPVPDGRYMSSDLEMTFHTENYQVVKVDNNLVRKSIEGRRIEIEDAFTLEYSRMIDKKVTSNGKALSDSKIVDHDGVTYDLENGRINGIYFLQEYELKGGYRVKVEQKRRYSISKGDKVIEKYPANMPDGKYRVKGRLEWLNIRGQHLI